MSVDGQIQRLLAPLQAQADVLLARRDANDVTDGPTGIARLFLDALYDMLIVVDGQRDCLPLPQRADQFAVADDLPQSQRTAGRADRSGMCI